MARVLRRQRSRKTALCYWKRLWGRDCKEETVITHLTLGHGKLNYTLHKTGKHPTLVLTHCNQLQSVEPVAMESSGGTGIISKEAKSCCC